MDDILRALADAGVSAATLVFGAVGAALGIAYTPAMTRREMLAALLAGLACSAILPQLIAQWIHLNPVANNALSFLFGIGGMFIVPGLLAAWAGFRTDPWAFIDRLRGIKKDSEAKP